MELTTRRKRGLGVVLVGSMLLLGTGSIVGAQGAPGEATVTVPVAPVRILDTRDGTGTGGLTTPIPANGEIELAVAGAAGVPTDAVGAVLNVTVTDGTEKSFLTVYPAGTERPKASVLNIEPGLNLPNMITAKLSEDGALRLYNYAGSVHVTADIAGYLVTASQSGGTPGPQGPQGPQGAPGPQGPQGTPGTATAYASVIGSSPTPFFEAKSATVATVYRPAGTVGLTCITFTTPITPDRLASAVVSSTWWSALAFPWSGGCRAGELGVHTLTKDTGAEALTDYHVIVP